MNRLRPAVLAAAQAAFGLMWLAAAVLKIVSPLLAYEFTTHVLPPGACAKAALAATIAAEALLGAAMLLRVVRGFGLSLAALAAATAALLVVREQSAGELVPCGCLGDLLGTTLDGAIARNAAAGAVLVALILWSRGTPAADSISGCPS